MAINIAYQLQLSRLVPQVIKNKDYDSYFQLITRINDILNNSGLDLEFAESYIYQKKKGPEDKLTPKEVKRHTKYAVTGLRCMIVKHLTGLSFRDLSIRIAESQLLQNFCRINNVDKVKALSKSQLQRYSICFSQDSINNLIKDLFFKASSKDNTLNLCTPFNAEDIYIDATCLEANIHFPVDWLLLRDGMISLLKSILVIRKHGLKHRMKPPEHFINDINNLCIEMSNTRRKPGSKKRRKEIFRQLKALSKVIRSHAKRYYNLLNEQWEKRTDLSEGQVNEVLRRIDDINEKLP